jgi:hypothetical protein
MSPGDLELEDSPAKRAESTFGVRFPIRGQIARLAQCQMHLLIEVFAEFAITPEHFVRDVLGNEGSSLLEESLVLGAQFDV